MRYYSALCGNITTNITHPKQIYYKGQQDVLKSIITDQEPYRPFYYDFRGTIVPSEWKTITTNKSKKLSRGALELYAIIVSWFNCKQVKDKETGTVTLVPKFEGDELRKNYAYFVKELGVSQEQVRRYFTELKAANLVTMELRTIWHKNWRYPNTLCIKLNKEAPHFTKEGAIANSRITNKLDNAALQLNIKQLNNSPSNIELKFTQNTALEYETLDKKIWTIPHQKVESTPLKSGVHIRNNYLKTSKTNIRSDQDKTDFANSNNFNQIHETVTTEAKPQTGQGDAKGLFDPEEDYVASRAYKPNIHIPFLSPQSLSSSLRSSINSNTTTQYTDNIRKPLSAFHPLTEEDAIYLRKSSGRPFNLSFINKLLLKLSAKFPEDGAYTKRQLLSKYLTLRLISEKTNPEIGNLENFNFKPIEGTEEYTNRQRYNYLKKIEQSTQTDPITLIKRRIIGYTAGDDEYAYKILHNCSLPYIPYNSSQNKKTYTNIDASLDNTTKSNESSSQLQHLTRCTIKISSSITQSQKEIILRATQEVLGQGVDITFKDKTHEIQSAVASESSTQSNSNLDNVSNISLKSEPAESATSSSPLWQRIRDILKSRYGEAVDKSWFSKLDIGVNEELKQCYIQCPTPFMRDWIKNNYEQAIENAIKELVKAEELKKGSNLQQEPLLYWINSGNQRGIGIDMDIVCIS